MVRYMKKSFVQIVLIYVILILFLFLSFGSYAIYIFNSEKNYSYLMGLIIAALFFILLGFLFGNHIHKKGLIFGCLLAVIHLFLIKLIVLLATNDYTFNPLSFSIYTICGGIGGFLGINFKKFI